MKSANRFLDFLLCITFEEIVLIYMTEAVIVRKVSSFKEMKLVPDEAYRIDDIKQVFSVSACLLECSRKDDCQSVIHEGSKCSLYNTTLVTGQKKPEQNVLAMNKTAMINQDDLNSGDYKLKVFISIIAIKVKIKQLVLWVKFDVVQKER
ncbi:hypothetical protein LSH36_434g02039 [Paralvinella palmiformis]|uniref:Uncharacterized protein n=1 Tax=Paralvinella palmiformis TaxID=53620 RepID=A0AAD9N0M1_9ANNE|nr:hypothetical protein LSH36_434g02039 [Paralvinella palmiformis]